uniref:Beta-1,4-galactosyltransferase n=1 Tax=Leptobrachium leishanense TaxID=445787 RepID=A0A8C5PHC4_9ANUR
MDDPCGRLALLAHDTRCHDGMSGLSSEYPHPSVHPSPLLPPESAGHGMAMVLNGSLSYVVYRLRILLLMILIVVVVTWASLYLESTRYTRKPKSPGNQFWRQTSLEKNEDKPASVLEQSAETANVKVCPQLSPSLRGVVPLNFDPSLTLEQVKSENPLVQNGIYRPESCQAQQKVAILIPHRNREKHLLYLLTNLHPFLQRQQLEYGIYVIHQAGNTKFNRAKLLNVGYAEALKEEKWDCFIFHDVDLLPENDFNLYLCDSEPKHMVVGRNATGYKLRYKGYFGGVSAMTRGQFAKVNGYSNNYWGWGGEDDDLRRR